MTTVTPLTQSPHESLLNALQIAQLYAHERLNGSPAFGDISRLLRNALMKLGEPHPYTVELTRRYLEAACGRSVDDREARDFAMVVITSALKWEAP